PACDIQARALGHDSMGCVLIQGQVVFVTRALQGQAEAITEIGALGAGGGRRQKGREAFRLRVTLPDGRVGGALVGLVVLAQRKERKPGPDPAGLLDLGQPHRSAIGPGTEEVDVDGRLTDSHLVVECTEVAPASWGMTSVSNRWSGSRS